MAIPQYMPVVGGGRSLTSLLGQRTLAQPAYDPFSGKQYNQGDKVATDLGLKLPKLLNQANPVAFPIPPKLEFGWASNIGHITTSAATTKRRRTNPLLAAPLESTKRNNPFVVPENSSSDLFGLNIPT